MASTLNEEGPAGGEPQGPMVQVEVTDREGASRVLEVAPYPAESMPKEWHL